MKSTIMPMDHVHIHNTITTATTIPMTMLPIITNPVRKTIRSTISLSQLFLNHPMKSQIMFMVTSLIATITITTATTIPMIMLAIIANTIRIITSLSQLPVNRSMKNQVMFPVTILTAMITITMIKRMI